MNRRGFLGTLIAGAAGLLLPKDALWLPEPGIIAPALDPHAIIGLRHMTYEIARLLSQYAPGRVVHGGLIGEAGLIRQFTVDGRFPPTVDHTGIDQQRFLVPIAAALAKRVSEGNATYGELPIVMHGAMRCERVSGQGVSVRGIEYYDIGFNENLIRFDVLCG
jgi:hypothetical protein